MSVMSPKEMSSKPKSPSSSRLPVTGLTEAAERRLLSCPKEPSPMRYAPWDPPTAQISCKHPPAVKQGSKKETKKESKKERQCQRRE